MVLFVYFDISTVHRKDILYTMDPFPGPNPLKNVPTQPATKTIQSLVNTVEVSVVYSYSWCFSKNGIIVPSKFMKITRIFEKIDDLKNQRVI